MVESKLRSTLGLVWMNDPGGYDAVRKNPPPNIIQELVMRYAFKGQHERKMVRGDFVAIDSLSEALLREGGNKYRLVCQSRMAISDLQCRIEREWKVRKNCFEFTTFSALHQKKDVDDLTALVYPTIAFAEGFNLRNVVGMKRLPVMSLSHGLATPRMLYDSFLKMMLISTYPWDCIVCGSTASRTAVQNILDSIKDEVERGKGIKTAFNGALEVVPLCVDVEALRPVEKRLARKQFGVGEGDTVLLYMGRVSRSKADIIPLIKVFSSLIDENPSKRLLLVIAGTCDREYEAELTRVVRDASIIDSVRFISAFPDSLKCAIYSIADICVLLADSLQESFGIVPVEAMACGVPQVASDWNGYRDTIRHGETGFLVPTYWAKCDTSVNSMAYLMNDNSRAAQVGQSIATDVPQLKAYIQILISNFDLRTKMGEYSRAVACERYSFGAVAKQYDQLAAGLNEIARHSSDAQDNGLVLKPRYFSCFSHYATQIVDDATALVKSELFSDIGIAVAVSTYRATGGSSPLIMEALLRRLNDTCQVDMVSETSFDGSFTLREILLALNSGEVWEREDIVKAVMWLLKQGYVKVATKLA